MPRTPTLSGFAPTVFTAAFLAVASGGVAAGVESLAPGRPPSAVPGTVVEPPAHDLELDGWDEEEFGFAAGKALGAIVDWVSAGAAGDAAPPVSAGARAARFRPAATREVFNDGGGVTVFRGPDGEGEATGPWDEAAPGLAAVFAGHEAVHGKAKVVAVTRDGAAGWTTRAVVQWAGSRPDGGGTSVAAVWTARWDGGAGETPSLAAVEVSGYEETRVEGGGFTDRTAALLGQVPAFRDDLAFGVDHWLDRIEERLGITVGGWHGLALGDADGDGLDDLYVCNLGGLPNRLLVRGRDGTTEDRAAAAGVDWWESTQSALFGDFDNDGDQDLVVATLTGALFHENDGEGRFAVRFAIPLPGGIPYALAAADYDLDSDLDLFVACYSTRNLVGTQREVFERPVPYHDARNGARNVLLRNEGGWRWKQATREAGLDDGDRRFSYACAWDDYDNDGDPDLYIANDFGRNTLYRNDRAGPGEPVRFTEVAAAAGVEDIAAGMGVSWGDFDNDGRPDLHVSNMFSSAGNRVARLGEFLPESDAETRQTFLRHARGNSLFHNRGDGLFADVSDEAGITLGRWAWGCRFADLNNDGWKDLVVANGFITQSDSGDL